MATPTNYQKSEEKKQIKVSINIRPGKVRKPLASLADGRRIQRLLKKLRLENGCSF